LGLNKNRYKASLIKIIDVISYKPIIPYLQIIGSTSAKTTCLLSSDLWIGLGANYIFENLDFSVQVGDLGRCSPSTSQHVQVRADSMPLLRVENVNLYRWKMTLLIVMLPYLSNLTYM
jgi:hypothetical protein